MAGCKTGDPRCGSVISPCAETDTECKAKYPSLYGKGDFWKGSNYSSSYEKYDDLYNDDDGDADDDDDDDDDDYGSGEISRSLILSERLKEILSELSREERTELGHQAENMILDCEFNGRKCYYWDTVQYLSGEYGNCYTFNSAFIRQRPYKARQSGASYGFTVILYLEGHDYIPNLSQGRGMRIVVHPFKTMPFAVQNGKSLKPGEETYVGIRMTTLSRKGKPYGECGDNGSFTELFGYKYTIDVEMKCVFKFVNKYQQGKLDCQCNAACKTIEYNIEMSHNTWPDVSLWYDLVNIVCERSEEGCNALKEAGGDTDEQKTKVLRENFLRLHIYFQDLNYQKIEEVPEYEMEQFLSDLGGTMGLWVGASFITLMELFYFVICSQQAKLKNLKNEYDERKDVATKSKTPIVTNKKQTELLSEAWCGRGSDQKITRKSGFIVLVEPYDLIDRGIIQEAHPPSPELIYC
ncbi:hypothetical protein LSH36_26g10034 [Paralvinella palmiformis]|uniref:Uncharacterized protein n=1 Tax=Paralvinella palmiformis TaxID=53620 RepID=A0AAD9NHQ8_9ANNE|nr:hypothetical protein LSH36_26g10034 [Paralvinella palmiformis]